MRRSLLTTLAAAALLLPGAVPVLGQTTSPGGGPNPPTQPGTASPAPVAPSAPALGQAAPTSPGAGLNAADGRRASTVIGSNVYNDANDSIGSVRDLLLAPDGRPTTAVVSVGGFLGIGAKDVAVPYAELRWNGERERWMLPGATADNLRARPEFTFPDRR